MHAQTPHVYKVFAAVGVLNLREAEMQDWRGLHFSAVLDHIITGPFHLRRRFA